MPSSPSLLISGLDIYSPEPLILNGELVMYFGGWLTAPPNDMIYLSHLDGSAPVVVMNGVPYGIGQVNDPSIVTIPASGAIPAYLIMYFTGTTDPSDPLGSSGVYLATSWADDGVNWSAPVLVIEKAWLPAATTRDGKVELWANDNSTGGELTHWEMGGGGAVGAKTTVNPASGYINVDVQWRETIQLYQMLAEKPLPNGSSVVAYLSSIDGINFTDVIDPAVPVPPGQFRIGTPSMHPNTASLAYFGSTAETNSMGFSVWEHQWL